MHIDHRPSLCVCLGVYLLRIYIRSLLRPFARGRLHARFALVLDLAGARALCVSWLLVGFLFYDSSWAFFFELHSRWDFVS